MHTAKSVYDKEAQSFSYRARLRRFSIVNEMILKILDAKNECVILDIGGSEYYWKINEAFLSKYHSKVKIIIRNVGDDGDKDASDDMFRHIEGDACVSETYDLPFDMIHSNSVIEHVGQWSRIRAMAECIVTSRKPYYVQTPNFWFPIEPHYRAVGFHWLPLHARARLLLRKPRGFRSALGYDDAIGNVESVNLLTVGQMRELFKGAEIRREYVGPLTKSIIAIGR